MPEWVMQAAAVAVSVIGASGGVYAAIRADISAIREKAINAHLSAMAAHERIDNFYNRGKA